MFLETNSKVNQRSWLFRQKYIEIKYESNFDSPAGLINSILNCGHDAIAAATLSTEFSGRIAVRTASSSQRFLSATLTAAKNQ